MLSFFKNVRSKCSSSHSVGNQKQSLGRLVKVAFGAAIGLTLLCCSVGLVAFQLISAEFTTLKEERITELSNANQILAETQPMISAINAMQSADSQTRLAELLGTFDASKVAINDLFASNPTEERSKFTTDLELVVSGAQELAQSRAALLDAAAARQSSLAEIVAAAQ